MAASTISQGRIPIPGKSATEVALRVIGWGLVLAAALYYVLRNALPHFSLDQAYYGEHWSHAAWLLLHITGGMLALLLGPFQFWSGLRRRHMQVHRWTDRKSVV